MPERIPAADINAILDDLKHAADHLDDARMRLIGPYTEGHAVDAKYDPAGIDWHVKATLNAVIKYAAQLRVIVRTLTSGGLKENTRGLWWIDAGGTQYGPFDSLDQARTMDGIEPGDFIYQASSGYTP